MLFLAHAVGMGGSTVVAAPLGVGYYIEIDNGIAWLIGTKQIIYKLN